MTSRTLGRPPEIQRVGGSEALDEPYQHRLRPDDQKRAGWLTALFLGEMLTATAIRFLRSGEAKAVVLALFVPHHRAALRITGGNVGHRALALGGSDSAPGGV